MANPDDEPGDGRRVLVPVANPETADALLDTAIDLAADGGELVVLRVVTIPSQVPLSAVEEGSERQRERLLGDAREVVADCRRRAEEAGVPATAQVRVGRDVAGGILETVEEREVDTVLMGWRGRPRRRDVVLGSYVDRVVRDADCDVLVKRIEPRTREIGSILVPTGGGPHATFAAEVAGALARRHGASVHAITVAEPGASGRDPGPEGALADAVSALAGVETVRQRVVEAEDVVGAIVAESANHDLTVVGASREPALRTLLFGDVPEAVGRRAESPVMMAKRDVGVPSRLRGALERLGERFG
jgi:nucleotide-binding universal stress UspA family protein